MARFDGRNWLGGSGRLPALLLLAAVLTHGVKGQRVKVEPEVLSYPGQTLQLRCAFSDSTSTQLTMLTWIYEAKDGDRVNVAVLHPTFGPSYPESPLKGRVSFMQTPPEMANPSIQISSVRMSDEGRYICDFATYPQGNEQGITELIMLAKPRNSASIVAVEAGPKPVVVARCESADGRPAAQISWVTKAKGNASTSSKTNANNTVTVLSEYRLAPAANNDGEDLTCLVAHRTQTKQESFPLKLVVQYPPQVTIMGYDNNWYIGRTNVVLTCQATGNPFPVSVLWKAMSGAMPESVQIKDNQLKVLRVDETVNTTFVCEVKNRIGLGKDQVTVLVRDTRLPEKGPTTGSIIGAIIGVIILVAIVGTGIAMYRKHRSNKLNGDGPPKYKPPPPNKNGSSAGRPNATPAATAAPPPVPETQPLTNLDYRTLDAEPVTDLDAYQDNEDEEGEHYYSAAPSGWDDPGSGEAPPFYRHANGDPQDRPGPTVGREDSFVSPAMFV